MDKFIYPIVTRNYFYLPVWLAEKHGLFRANGLDVQVIYKEAPADTPCEMVRARQCPFGAIGMEHLFADREAGGHLVAIGGSINGLPFSLIAQPGIRSVADLRGKTIGVSSLKFGTSGILTKYLARHGMGPGDYRLFEMGPIEKRWAMLQSGEIDAGMQGAPMNFVAIDAGFTDLGALEDVYPAFQFSSIFADRLWAQANRDLTVRFLRSVLQGTRLFYADKAKATEVAMERMEISRDYADRAWDDYTRARIFPMDGAISVQGVQETIEMSAAVRSAAGRAAWKPEDFIDLSFMEEAQRSLG